MFSKEKPELHSMVNQPLIISHCILLSQPATTLAHSYSTWSCLLLLLSSSTNWPEKSAWEVCAVFCIPPLDVYPFWLFVMNCSDNCGWTTRSRVEFSVGLGFECSHMQVRTTGDFIACRLEYMWLLASVCQPSDELGLVSGVPCFLQDSQGQFLQSSCCMISVGLPHPLRR